jgi:putative transposase
MLDRTLVWNQWHLMIVLRKYELFYNTYRTHRPLKQGAPLRPLPDGITSLDQFQALQVHTGIQALPVDARLYDAECQ